MSDEAIQLIKQAKEEARRDNVAKFFKANAKFIIGAVAAALLITIIIAGVSAYNAKKRAEFSALLHQTLIDQQLGEIEKSKTGLKAIYNDRSAPAGVKSLASLRYAAFLFQEGNKSEAVSIYEEVNKCRACNVYVRDVAGLLAIKILMADKEEASKEGLLAKIKRIEGAAKPLKYQIQEQRALLEMKNNHLEKAYELFENISQKANKSSAALKERAKNSLKMIVAKGYKPAAQDLESAEK